MEIMLTDKSLKVISNISWNQIKINYQYRVMEMITVNYRVLTSDWFQDDIPGVLVRS